jgi:hypothetical protein
MARLPYAATRLIQDVQAIKPSAKAQPADDPDGLRVHRTIKFGKRESSVIYRVLLHIQDSRIESFHLTDAGYLHVTFVAGPRADRRGSFYLQEALTVAEAQKPTDQVRPDGPDGD